MINFPHHEHIPPTNQLHKANEPVAPTISTSLFSVEMFVFPMPQWLLLSLLVFPFPTTAKYSTVVTTEKVLCNIHVHFDL